MKNGQFIECLLLRWAVLALRAVIPSNTHGSVMWILPWPPFNEMRRLRLKDIVSISQQLVILRNWLEEWRCQRMSCSILRSCGILLSENGRWSFALKGGLQIISSPHWPPYLFSGSYHIDPDITRLLLCREGIKIWWTASQEQLLVPLGVHGSDLSALKEAKTKQVTPQRRVGINRETDAVAASALGQPTCKVLLHISFPN